MPHNHEPFLHDDSGHDGEDKAVSTLGKVRQANYGAQQSLLCVMVATDSLSGSLFLVPTATLVSQRVGLPCRGRLRILQFT